jgi:hypothetical protein
VRFIYRLISRKPDFLGQLAIFDITPIGRFLGLLGEFTVAHNVKVLVFEYPSIDVHCIVLPVIFNGGLFISVLRNRQLLTNEWGQKITGNSRGRSK